MRGTSLFASFLTADWQQQQQNLTAKETRDIQTSSAKTNNERTENNYQKHYCGMNSIYLVLNSWSTVEAVNSRMTKIIRRSQSLCWKRKKAGRDIKIKTL